MQQRTTERPECSDLEKKHAGDPLGRKAKKFMVQGVKFVLRALLLRPATWHWLMVKVPEYWDKTIEMGKAVSAWLFDSF